MLNSFVSVPEGTDKREEMGAEKVLLPIRCLVKGESDGNKLAFA